jgi:hypothetical protein
MKVSCNLRDRAPVELSGSGRFVLSRNDFIPAYVRAFEERVLQERAEQAV